MRPVDGAVLAVLMVLLTTAQSMSPKRTTELYGRRTIETTRETTTEPITTVCPTIACDDPRCFLEYGPNGCPIQCNCGDPICMLHPCGPDEECVPNYEDPSDYICVPKYETVCPDISGCDGTCHVDYTNIVDGCPRCICVDLICGWLLICGAYEDCVKNDAAPFGYSCVSKYASSTTSTTPSWTTTERCPPLICIGPCQLATDSNGCPYCNCQPTPCPTVTCYQGCRTATDSNGCTYCDCPPSCEGVHCAYGEKCELLPTPCAPSQYPCYPRPACVPITETTTPCPVVDCYPPCASDKVSYRCPSCVCPPSCQGHDCSYGYECQLVDVFCNFSGPCFPQPKCVAKQETTTPCPVIDCYPPCVLDRVSYRCPTCVCPPSCQGHDCSYGYECQLVDVLCNFVGPCFRQPKCVPKKETTTPCPLIKCAPYCVSDTGSDGCPTCACPPSCQTVKCSAGHECQLVNVTCKRYPCFSQPQCVPINTTSPPPVSCPPVTCLPNCVSDVGPDGCTTCVCPRVCNMLCIIGYECVLVNVTCERYPCFPEPQCVPKQGTTTAPCRMYKCAPNCVPGKGPDGCPTCECPPSCQTVKCSAGHECQLVNVTCIRYPCFPQPQCVPIKNPCKGTPNTRRCGRFRNRWTYNSVTDKCEKFFYYGCTPSLNTFLTPKACKNKCQGSSQIVCPAVVCEKNCYTLTRKGKCPKCICPNPCEGFECHFGDECKLQEAECEDEDPEPFCTPIPCPAQKDPCVKRCKYGFQADKNGCLLCDCLEERSPYY